MSTRWILVRAWLHDHLKDDRAASLVEYALLVALIALVAVGAVTLGGGSVSTIFGNIASALSTAA